MGKIKFKFIDLFAGIGGFHIAMSNLGGECVFASEIDAHARKTYLHNFDINEKDFNQDITKMNIKKFLNLMFFVLDFHANLLVRQVRKEGLMITEGTCFLTLLIS